MKLNELKCRSFKPEQKPYKRADGGGLYMEIMPHGAKYWRMQYYFLGKHKRIAFGVYPEVSLKEARDKRDEARKLVRDGKNPAALKQQNKVLQSINYENNFEAIAREWHQGRSHMWQPTHAENIMKRLETYIFSIVGARPIRDITPPEILHAVRPIENDGKHEMAHRVMQICSQIFRFAVASGKAERDVTQNLRGVLKPVKSKHDAHLKEDQLPKFLSKLNVYDKEYNGNPLTRLGFQLFILTLVRSGEI